MWWIRLVNVASHIPVFNTAVKAVAHVAVKVVKGLMHSNVGLLGLDRIFSHLGF
jgi:hypothetical protein